MKRKHEKILVKSASVLHVVQTLIVQVDEEGSVPNTFGLEGVVGVNSPNRS